MLIHLVFLCVCVCVKFNHPFMDMDDGNTIGCCITKLLMIRGLGTLGIAVYLEWCIRWIHSNDLIRL